MPMPSRRIDAAPAAEPAVAARAVSGRGPVRVPAPPGRRAPPPTALRAAALAALVATMLAAPAAADETVVDAHGRRVTVADTARVVSIGGTVTEILYDLGLADRIVAVDSTSLFPPQALAEKASVGYMRALSAEGVIATGPSLILAIDGSGPPPVIDVLAASGVPFVAVDDDPSRAAVTRRVRFLAGLMGAEQQGERLVAEIEANFAALDAARAEAIAAPRVLFVIAFRDGQPMVGGADTAADAIVTLAGGVNAAAGFSGYKPMSEEAVLAAAPEVVVAMAHAGAAADPFAASPALAATPAGAAKRFVEMDGLSLLGFGPRTPAVALALARAIGAVPATAAAGGTP